MTSKKLLKLIESDNLVDDLDEQEVHKIGLKAKYGFEEDVSSSAAWLQDANRIVEIASLVAKKKNYPLPNSANIKYPLITKACYEFSSRVYPEIIQDGKMVKGRVIGRDPDMSKKETADRVCDFMNWQLLYESDSWEIELDRLLHMLALIGFMCKKTYYDPICKQNKSEVCDYKDIVINSNVNSLEDATRISHIMHLRLNDFVEHVRAGLFCKEPVDELIDLYGTDDLDPVIDIVEQHRFLDLDEDGYNEPYIVTFIKDSGKVLRINARFTEEDIYEEDNEVKRIKPIQMFTDYHFLVSPTGKFQSVGFGVLLLHVNETVNTIFNQLIDAGSLANMQGGYIDSRLKPMSSGDTLHDPGEWKILKASAGLNSIKDGIFPINYKEPSQVLFNLLGTLIEAAKDLSSSTEVMTGATNADNAKSNAVALLQQQGLKIFKSIGRRVYRSLTKEYRKLFHLNRIYLDPNVYVEVLDDRLSIANADFDESKVNIIPVADPAMASEIERVQKLQILQQLASTGAPGIDPLKVTRLIVEGLKLPPELVMVDPNAQQPPNPAMIKLQADIQSQASDAELKGRELAIKEKELALDALLKEAQILQIKTLALKNVADAEATEAGSQFNDVKQQLDIIDRGIQVALQDHQMNQDLYIHKSNLDAQNVQPEVTNGQANQGTDPNVAP